jgi:predicted RNase H-like nuclease (RuvC/YqgF family)
MSSRRDATSILENVLDLLLRFEGNFNELRTKLGEAMDVVKKAEEDSRSELDNKDDNLRRLREENAAKASQLKEIEDQMAKISKTYQELAGKQTEAVDVRELLTIYVTLLEQVFEGRPHAKILWLLHGKKTVLTRSEINKTSGFQPAIVLKSIFDLANANLINYNENTQELSLKRKLY